MRILHLLASPVWSGPAENVALLALAQRALGHQVTVAVDRKREGLGSEEPGAPRLRELGLLDEGGLELSVKSTPVAMARDALALGRRTLEVVHAHFSHDHLVARFGLPRGARLVRSIHAPRSLRWTLPRADAFTVPSEGDAARLDGRPVLVLPPLLAPEFGPPSDREALRAELAVAGDPVIGMVSTFQASRRHDLALEAFACLRRERPRAHLVLVGDGVLEPRVREQVARHGLAGAVTFCGYQRGAAYLRWLQVLDEVWVLGLGMDYSGRIAAQARACQVRVLAVAQGGLPALADVVLGSPSGSEIAAASLSGARLERTMPSNEATARAVLSLYGAQPPPGGASR